MKFFTLTIVLLQGTIAFANGVPIPLPYNLPQTSDVASFLSNSGCVFSQMKDLSVCTGGLYVTCNNTSFYTQIAENNYNFQGKIVWQFYNNGQCIQAGSQQDIMSAGQGSYSWEGTQGEVDFIPNGGGTPLVFKAVPINGGGPIFPSSYTYQQSTYKLDSCLANSNPDDAGKLITCNFFAN